MKLKPTPAEQKILDAVLREMRFAVCLHVPLQVTFDPFFDDTGAHVLFTYSESGAQIMVSGALKRAKWPSGRPNPRRNR